MNNAELIKALRYCGTVEPNNGCDWCPMKGVTNCVDVIERDAADALEAAEQRIAELESVKCHCNVKENAELIARILDDDVDGNVYEMPKEGEWIESNTRPRSAQFYCSVCHRTCYDIQPTRDKAWTKRCRYHYCPNCGARMKGERNE